MQQQYSSHEENGRFPTLLVTLVAVGIAVAIAMGLLMSYYASTNPYYGYSGGWGMMGGSGGYWLIFMFPIGIIVLAVIGYALYRGFG